MAKAKPQSKHTRAARRADSPELAKPVPRAETTDVPRESILSERANAGVSKKQKSKPLTKAQRQRQQKGMEKAEMVMDQLETKVTKSVKSGKAVDERRADWEEMNRKASIREALRQQTDGNNHDDGDDNDDDDDMVEDSAAPKSTKQESKPVNVAQDPVVDDHAAIDVDEEIT